MKILYRFKVYGNGGASLPMQSMDYMQRVNLFHISRDNLHMLYEWMLCGKPTVLKVHIREGRSTVENSSGL